MAIVAKVATVTMLLRVPIAHMGAYEFIAQLKRPAPINSYATCHLAEVEDPTFLPIPWPTILDPLVNAT